MGRIAPLHCRARRSLITLLGAMLSFMVAAATASSLGAPTAFAENTLVSSVPANNATLAVSPSSMVFTFAQPLGPTNTAVASCNGETFQIGTVAVAPDGITATIPVPNPFPSGTCTVVVIVSDLDSSVNGQFSITFNVTGDAATAETTITVAEPSVDPAATIDPSAPVTVPAIATANADDEAAGSPKVGGPLGLSRLVAALALAVLFGSFVLIVTAWPEGVEYILTVRFLRTAWAVAVLGSAATAVFLTAQTTGASVGASLSPAAWIDLKDSAPGLAALARVALAGACGWVVIRPERCLDPSSQLPALAIPALAVATFGLSRTGGDLMLVGIVAGIAHALAMAIWLGGVVLLARVVLAGPGEDDLVHAVRGFSRISTPALLMTVVTGAVLTWRLDRGALFDTLHGQVLLLKAVAVGVMVFVGLATRQFVSSRLREAESMTAPMASRLRRATGVEAGGGVIVLVLTSWLLSLTPAGIVDTGSNIDYAYDQGRFVLDNGADVTVLLTGGVGRNGVRVEIAAPATGVTSVIVTFRPPDATGSPTTILTLPAELNGADIGAAVLPEAEGVPLLMAGLWTLEISVTTPLGTSTDTKTFNLT